jgi:hypothetical protein
MTYHHNTIGYCPHCEKPKRRPRRDLHHEFQVALIEHLRLHEHLHPELELIYANPMGELRDQKQDKNGNWYSPAGKRLKAEGAKSGSPDLFLPVVVHRIHHEFQDQKWPGLYIEIKINEDDLSPPQRWWRKRLMEQGYCYYVARDLQVTLGYILAYLRGEV